MTRPKRLKTGVFFKVLFVIRWIRSEWQKWPCNGAIFFVFRRVLTEPKTEVWCLFLMIDFG